MPKLSDIKKVLVIGSGPIIIGQAAEFDYAGTQACRALREEGIEVVLVNSNPATIMTDTDIADQVYIEPLTVPVIRNIIKKERPDSMLATLGGQTGLNLAMELSESGVLDEFDVKLLGTGAESIKKAEDREAFKTLMNDIDEPIIESVIADTYEQALAFANEHGYPVIIRPAYTLGGTGGGIASDEAELREITMSGLQASRVHQVLVEKSVAGYKEIEYEVLRDGKGNCITVCNMENIDPVGIHTGDSIVIAPSQTLRDAEYQLLRTASINIINALEDPRRVQRAVRARYRQHEILCDRGQPARQPFLRAGKQSDGLPDRAGRGQDRGGLRPRRDQKRRDGQDVRLLRADAGLRGRQVSALAVRQVHDRQ